MWFNPDDSLKTKQDPLATSATFATFNPDERERVAESRKVAKVADHFNSENLTVTPKPSTPESRKVAKVADHFNSENLTVTPKPSTPESRKVAKVAEADSQKTLAWLSHIGETDQDMIDETLSRCAENPDTLAYFLMRSTIVPVSDQFKADIAGCR